MSRKNTVQDFWNKVSKPDRDACWEWQGAKDTCGYGMMNWQQGHARTHRVSWLINRGEIPHGQLVLHKCDNPACVNPEHLFLGSHADNQKDAALKNRKAKKLTIAEVEAIRAQRSLGVQQKAIAANFGICQSQVSRITNHTRRIYV